MAIKGLGRKTSTKNPPILSHEFVIQNHADIVSCFAMVFVVGLMVQATSPIASIFVALHHNITGAEPSAEHPRGLPFTFETGWKDWCAVVFYTLICIIMHAVLQEYAIDKISKRLHLSKFKFKLARFNDLSQLIVFYLISFLWGADVILRENYLGKVVQLWENYPEHPMIFLHKLYFIIQLAYYFHMLPEIYFQRVKKEDQQSKIIHSICSFSFIALAYFLSFQRLALVLLTLHYLGEIVSSLFQLIGIFDRDEKLSNLVVVNKLIFVLTRFLTMVLAVLTLYYGIESNEYSTRGIVALLAIFTLQGYLVFQFISELLREKRDTTNVAESNQSKLSKKPTKSEKSKKERKRESDLPEVDQEQSLNNVKKQQESKKLK